MKQHPIAHIESSGRWCRQASESQKNKGMSDLFRHSCDTRMCRQNQLRQAIDFVRKTKSAIFVFRPLTIVRLIHETHPFGVARSFAPGK